MKNYVSYHIEKCIKVDSDPVSVHRISDGDIGNWKTIGKPFWTLYGKFWVHGQVLLDDAILDCPTRKELLGYVASLPIAMTIPGDHLYDDGDVYPWIITETYNCVCNEATPITGPRTITDAQVAVLVNGGGHQFKMYDDDGVLYYYGRCAEQEFSPLDDYGTPNAGCTEIRYHNAETGEWDTL